MTESIFPLADEVTYVAADGTQQGESLPLAVECAWDFTADRPILKDGAPVAVTGLEAVRVWAWNQLHIQRARQRCWSWAVGCELERLVGQSWQEATKRAEAVRLIREALLVSPYITAAEVEVTELTGDCLKANVTIQTVYGEGDIYV